MSSFVRMNKTRISKIKNTLEKALRDFYRSKDWIIWDCDIHITLPLVRNLDMGYSTGVYMEKFRVLVEEYGSRVIFGIDLQNAVVRESEYTRSNLVNSIWYQAYPRFRFEIDKELGVSGVPYSYMDILSRTSLYKDIVEHMSKSIIEVKPMLRPGEFPYISNRYLLPLFVLDKDTCSGWYIFPSYGCDSYRKNHNNISFLEMDFAENCGKAVRGIPNSLVHLVVDGYSNRLS